METTFWWDLLFPHRVYFHDGLPSIILSLEIGLFFMRSTETVCRVLGAECRVQSVLDFFISALGFKVPVKIREGFLSGHSPDYCIRSPMTLEKLQRAHLIPC